MAGRRAAALAVLVATLTMVGAGGAIALAPLPQAPPAGAGDGAPVAGGPGDAGSPSLEPTTAAGDRLVGLFAVTAGSCTSGAVPNGSWFRMVQPGGDAENGPFVDNNDSPCDDKSATTLRPGSDGGLVTGQHQPAPDPAWDSNGNGLSDRIVQPQRFYGVGFAAATNPTDPQTATKVPAPALFDDGGKLNGDVRAFGVAWNRQHFNQGAPKPDGSTPGQTAPPAGTYDRGSGAFVLEWASQIEGGPFNGFTGVWHLEGTFRPSHVEAAGGTGSGSGSGGSATGTGPSSSGAFIPPAATRVPGPAGAHPRTGWPAPWAAAAVIAALAGARMARRARGARW